MGFTKEVDRFIYLRAHGYLALMFGWLSASRFYSSSCLSLLRGVGLVCFLLRFLGGRGLLLRHLGSAARDVNLGAIKFVWVFGIRILEGRGVQEGRD